MSYSVTRFSQWLFAFAVLATLGATPAVAATKDLREKYILANLGNVTNYLVQSGLIPVETDSQALEFVLITECDIYKMIAGSPFKQQELKNGLIARLKKVTATEAKSLFVRIDSVFILNGYNFDTQSISIAPQSQIRNANVFDVVPYENLACANKRANELKNFIPSYAVKLNYPISLLRVPMKKDIAESLLSTMDRYGGGGNNVVYGTLYIQIEPVAPTVQRVGASRRAILHGQVDVIDLYLDQDRKVMFKRFNYAENY